MESARSEDKGKSSTQTLRSDIEEWDLRFKSLYAEALSRHEELTSLPEEIVDAVAKELRLSQSAYESKQFVLMTVATIALATVSPFLLGLLLLRAVSSERCQAAA
jgi:hypothetical protein